MKKKFYQRWWFWLVVAVFLIGSISSNANTSSIEDSTATPSLSTQDKVIHSDNTDSLTESPTTNPTKENKPSPEVTPKPSSDKTDVLGNLEMHVIDVGQADSILIKLPNKETMLIDAGNNTDENTISNYLKKENVSTINYFIATHPHADHIGSAAAIIRNFDVKSVYAPKVSHNTRTYENFLNAVIDKGLKIKSPEAGTNILNNSNLRIQVLAPVSASYKELNNYSIVLKVTYNNVSILLTGDAEDLSESEILSKGFDLRADILKIGHHGSSSSTTSAFLNKVKPSHGVISVGKDNSYGHPHESVLDRLHKTGVKIYRTDVQGSIIFTTDGNKIDVNKSPVSINDSNNGKNDENNNKNETKPTEEPNTSNEVYIGNKNSKKFHRDSCRSLPDPQNQVKFNNRDDAINQGYDPCKICKP